MCVYYCSTFDKAVRVGGLSEVCVFITAVPITKLFAWGRGETMEDMCYVGETETEACVD